ncbi:deaminase [Mycobacterium paraffinicum]|uniref:deaminase n=1 Tax=Mycobacterium paraffinicum TaxID=53378 RepID=UPI0009FFBEAA|nr:deaminase [Mycobacterium paraffinicum]
MPEEIGSPGYDPTITSTWGGLVFGIVRPVGVDRDQFVSVLTQQLIEFGYTVQRVHLSSLFTETYMSDPPPLEHLSEADRINALIDAGDKLCEVSGTAAAVALCGVLDIHQHRKSIDPTLERVAYIVDSIKRVEEYYQLQNIYGDRYIQFGLQSSDENRRNFLKSKLQAVTFAKSEGQIDSEISLLMDRDLRESGSFGQNTMRAFPVSDVFVDMDADIDGQVARVVNLLFDSPQYEVPTTEEYGMQLAYISSTRSPELGLKVGAAILSQDQRVIAMGVNAHPEDKEQSPTFDVSASDIGKLVLDTVQSLASDYFTDAAKTALQDDADRFTRELLEGALKSARIRDLTEFQPTVHAEMSALLDALRTQSSLEGATMYVTAYPCHGCAKHLVDLNLPVVYLEPYPKSRAAAMYGSTVSRIFRAFTGVAPVRYQKMFAVADDRKLPDGTRRTWTHADRLQAQPKVDADVTISLISEREVEAIGHLPDPNNVDLMSEDPLDVRPTGNTELNADCEVPSDPGSGGGK